MRFRNSNDYFGLTTHARNPITRNSATGKAFRIPADGDPGALTNFASVH
jgi:hypothetical protein